MGGRQRCDGAGEPKAPGRGAALAEVSAPPARDAAERAEGDRLMAERRYPGLRCPFGGRVRHVAEPAHGSWQALVGRQVGSFKLKAHAMSGRGRRERRTERVGAWSIAS